jgi:hypothetical protein
MINVQIKGCSVETKRGSDGDNIYFLAVYSVVSEVGTWALQHVGPGRRVPFRSTSGLDSSPEL